MEYLVFDTETTGLPKNYNGRMTDLDNWPRVIQLAWAGFDAAGNLLEKQCHLIKPDGWTIPTDEFWQRHGYTQERSEREGIPIIKALGMFIGRVNATKCLVAHNMNFDYNVLGAEMIRAGLRAQHKPAKICTKEAATEFCAIPGNYGEYKWPSLAELHTKLFKRSFEGAHDALTDVMACARCLFGLLEHGIIKPVNHEQHQPR